MICNSLYGSRVGNNVLFIFLLINLVCDQRMVTSITFSGAQSTVQAVQQALQMQQQMQMQQQGIQPYYSSMEYFYPVHQITPYGSSFLTIPYGTVFNL